MKKTILLFILCFTSISYAQDSLSEQWNKTIQGIVSNDSVISYSKTFLPKASKPFKVELYAEIASRFSVKVDEDSTSYYFDKAIDLGETIKNTEYLLLVYSLKAESFIQKEDYVTAEFVLDKAKKYFENNKDSRFSLLYYGVLSRFKAYQGYKKEGYELTDKAIEIAIRYEKIYSLANLYHNLGLQYFNDSKFAKATENLIKALKVKEDNNLKDIDVTHYCLGYSYYVNGNFELAKKYLQKGLKSSRKTGNSLVLMYSHSYMANLYLKDSLYGKTIKHLDSAKTVAQKINLPERKAQIDIQIGDLYITQNKDYEKAKSYYTQAYKTVKNGNIPHLRTTVIVALFNVCLQEKKHKKAFKYINLLENSLNAEHAPTLDSKGKLFLAKARYYKAIKNYKKSLDNHLQYTAVKDSSYFVESNVKITELEKKYDTEKKELKIEALNKEKKEQEFLTQQAKTKQNLYLILALLALSVLIAGFWVYGKLRKQKKELDTAYSKVNDINTVKNRLFSIIAHDLRSMLIPFQRAGKVLNHHVEKENYNRVKALSNELQNNSNRLSNMLDNLLNWSLEQMNGYVFKSEKLSLKEEFEVLITNFKQHAKDKNTTVELLYNKDCNILFDKGAFHVIFRNLISNALKYTENGTIKISFEKVNSILKCAIVDTGIGMDEEQQKQIFILEESNSTTGTQGEKGTGLGLNLVYRFVQMLNGKITVSSKLRIGTRFDLSFPILEASKEIENNSLSA